MSDPAQLPAWKSLQGLHAKYGQQLNILDELTSDPARLAKLTLDLQDNHLAFHFDFSKHLVNEAILQALLQLAREAKVEEGRDAMFRGEKINTTEARAVFHVALRHPTDQPCRLADNTDVSPMVEKELKKMAHLYEQVHRGEWKGYTNEPITDIVNIGIGGSDLGPKMVAYALENYAIPCASTGRPLNLHYVSNVDGMDLHSTLRKVRAGSTLFIVVSKTFTTQETMTNAHAARAWLLSHAKDPSVVARHFVAVSTNATEVAAFGIPTDPSHMYEFWDWVGGRYSLWSVVGLSVFLSIGPEHFRSLLAGAHWMDLHFRQAPLDQNAPVLMALLGIWYNNFCGAQSQAILPYEQALLHLPKYLQQADMESNGKSVTRTEEARVSWSTGPIIWGEPGTNGQHAFYQLLHQGTKLIPCDFIGGWHPQAVQGGATSVPGLDLDQHHRLLLANMIAQTEALMVGTRTTSPPGNSQGEGSLPLYRTFDGNRPSTSIFYTRLDPGHLGALIALYEHKIFVQGLIWNIASFDQWGVELGKKLTLTLLKEMSHPDQPFSHHDPSTLSLLARLKGRKTTN